MVSTGNRCQGRNRRGEPCAAFAVEGSRFCYWHSPDKAQERKEARSRGGRARHGRTVAGDNGDQDVRLASVADVVDLLERAVRDVLQLENSISRARCVGYLCGVAVKALEVAELESRIAALEVAVHESEGTG